MRWHTGATLTLGVWGEHPTLHENPLASLLK